MPVLLPGRIIAVDGFSAAEQIVRMCGEPDSTRYRTRTSSAETCSGYPRLKVIWWKTSRYVFLPDLLANDIDGGRRTVDEGCMEDKLKILAFQRISRNAREFS